ncbi:hypothetical protein D918_05465 [Trichuris suis]|nr:hypothetical protein D918_05465 [Trichuris suis]
MKVWASPLADIRRRGGRRWVEECEALGERSADSMDRSFLRRYMRVKRKLRVVGVSLR